MRIIRLLLLKHAHFRQDAQGKDVGLHYIRTKDGAEVDFALSEENQLTHLIECKLSDSSTHRALARFANDFAEADAVQIVCNLRQEEYRAPVHILDAANWLRNLAA